MPKAVERLRIASHGRDPGAIFRKAQRRSAPDTGRGARYQYRLSRKITHN
jgi:hypothetical protein